MNRYVIQRTDTQEYYCVGPSTHGCRIRKQPDGTVKYVIWDKDINEARVYYNKSTAKSSIAYQGMERFIKRNYEIVPINLVRAD